MMSITKIEEIGAKQMASTEPFSTSRQWFKGNLHTHSTISDGKLKPAEVVDLYKKLGYDFLAFTDHEIFSWWQEFSTSDFLIIPGIETSGQAPGPYQCHHIVGVGGSQVKPHHLEQFDNRGLQGLQGAQTMVDTLTEQGYLTIYCHPVWSRQPFDKIEDLQNFAALEVYNYGCQVENCTGEASYYWDAFLRQGRPIWGVATDDSHQHTKDYGGGWVVVNAPSLNVDEIVEALRLGHFYASSGPTIESYGVRDGQVYVHCSSAQAIHFIAFERRGKSFIADVGQTLTAATHTLHGDEKYVRIEVVDERGRVAWSNPILF